MTTNDSESKTCDVRKVRHDMSSAIAALQTAFDNLTGASPNRDMSSELFRLAMKKLRDTVEYIDRSTK